MPRVLPLACLVLLLAASRTYRADAAPAPLPRRAAPPPAWIIDELNANARRAGGLLRTSFEVDYKAGKTVIGLSGGVTVDCTGRSRVRAKVVGVPVIDTGHDGQTSWWDR